jgi:hypothetical protein
MSDLIWATVVDLTAYEAHLYFLNVSPSEQVLGQDPTTPVPEVYGRHESETIPVLYKYLQAVPRLPPLQPMLVESHSTISSGERTTLTLPPEAMQNLSERVSEAAKAQHEPHYFWSLMGWMQLPHWVLESKLAGTASKMVGSL